MIRKILKRSALLAVHLERFAQGNLPDDINQAKWFKSSSLQLSVLQLQFQPIYLVPVAQTF